MRARLVTLSLCLSVLLVLPSQANEKPTPEYQKAMKELGTVNNHLRNSLKDIDFAAIEGDGASPDPNTGVTALAAARGRLYAATGVPYAGTAVGARVYCTPIAEGATG